MCFFSNWLINWEAVSAVGTLLAVIVALGTTAYIEYRDYRRRMIEVKSMASPLYYELEINRKALIAEIAAFDAAPRVPLTNLSPMIPGTNGRHNRLALLRLSEGVKRVRFNVLKEVSPRIALFGEKDAIRLGMVIVAATGFQENQTMEGEGIFAIDDQHALGLEVSMHGWASSIVAMLGPAAERMAAIAGIERLPAPPA